LLIAWSAWGRGPHWISERDGHSITFVPAPRDDRPAPQTSIPVKAVNCTEGSGINSNAGIVGRIECDAECSPAPNILPREWYKLPNYVIDPPDILSVVVRSEGADEAVLKSLNGERLVQSDGSLNLSDELGSVQVGGLTLGELPAHIQDCLQSEIPDAQVSVTVFAQNSKVYYIITEGNDEGDSVMRNPVLGGETVHDALALLPEVDWSQKNVWIARPTPRDGGYSDEILAVNAAEVADGSDTSTNYSLEPGDRIFVVSQPRVWEALTDILSSTWETLIEMFW
jgi:hypothetical protein